MFVLINNIIFTINYMFNKYVNYISHYRMSRMIPCGIKTATTTADAR